MFSFNESINDHSINRSIFQVFCTCTLENQSVFHLINWLTHHPFIIFSSINNLLSPFVINQSIDQSINQLLSNWCFNGQFNNMMFLLCFDIKMIICVTIRIKIINGFVLIAQRICRLTLKNVFILRNWGFCIFICKSNLMFCFSIYPIYHQKPLTTEQRAHYWYNVLKKNQLWNNFIVQENGWYVFHFLTIHTNWEFFRFSFMTVVYRSCAHLQQNVIL